MHVAAVHQVPTFRVKLHYDPQMHKNFVIAGWIAFVFFHTFCSVKNPLNPSYAVH